MPLSGRGPEPAARFGAISTKVSPSNVFERSIARAALGIGAYFACSSTVTRVVESGSESSLTTLPTETPEIRTSPCRVSCAAAGTSKPKR
jgi:hypothetical protein